MNEIVSIFIIANLLIVGFYKIFQIKWPELYFAVNDQVSYFVSVSPLRYVLFRLLPPFLITAILAGSLNDNLNGNSLALFASFTCLSHALLTNGRSIYNLLFDPQKVKVYFNRYFQFIIHLFTLTALAITGYVAGYLAFRNVFLIVTPTLPGLVDNIWSTIITSFASVLLYEVYSKKGEVNVDNILSKSHKQISQTLINFIHEQSEKYKANEQLVLAVCIVENLQRPLWIRKVEKTKSYINKPGSYGIMQTKSDHYLNDKESIEKATKEYFANSKYEYMDFDTLEKWVSKYNMSSNYVELVKAAYNYLPSEDYDETLPG